MGVCVRVCVCVHVCVCVEPIKIIHKTPATFIFTWHCVLGVLPVNITHQHRSGSLFEEPCVITLNI